MADADNDRPGQPASSTDPTTPQEATMTTTATRPRAGEWVTVTRPDGVTYPALLQRYDGPQRGLAVLYSEPGFLVDAPADVPFYEHVVQIADLGNNAPLTRIERRGGPDSQFSDTYPLDDSGYAAVSRPFIRIRADEVKQGDLLILDSGLSRVTRVSPYTLGGNGVTVVHIAGATNVVRATHETVTVLR